MKSSFSGRSQAQTITGGKADKGFGFGRSATIEIGNSTTTGNSQSLFFVKNRIMNWQQCTTTYQRFDILRTK